MEIPEYLRVLARRWRWVVVLALVGLMGGYGYASAQRPVYEATAQLFVSVEGTSNTATDLQQGNTFTTQRMTSYTDIASGPLVTKPVVKEQGLLMTPEELGEKIEAVSPVDTVLIQLTVSDIDAERATRLANASARELATVIQDLERSSAAAGKSPVRATLTRPAIEPAAPVSPDVRRLAVLGLLAGLILGVAAAVLREITDRTIRDREGLESAAGVSVLGAIGIDTQESGRDLSAPDPLHAEDHRAESYRQLRTALTFVNVDHKLRSILVTSALPAEGKTTTTINLATVMAQTKAKVCVIDADLRRPALTTPLNLIPDVGITNILIGSAEFDEVVQKAAQGFDVLAAGPLPPNPSELLGSERMRHLLAELEARYDYVLFDTPPIGPVTDAVVLAASVDGVLLVARSRRATRDSVAAAVRTVSTVNGRVVGAVLNMQSKAPRDGYGGYSSYTADSRPDGSLHKRGRRPQESHRAGR